MKTIRGSGLWIALAATFVLGCLAGLAFSSKPSWSQGIPPLEYFSDTVTFSEVENARSTIEAEGRRFLMDIRSQYSGAIATGAVARQPALVNWIGTIEERLGEFGGTPQGDLIEEELLLVLGLAGDFDRWVDRYLRILYETPSKPAVVRRIPEAVRFAKLAGRESELAGAWGHLLASPGAFTGKEELRSRLMADGIPFEMRPGFDDYYFTAATAPLRTDSPHCEWGRSVQ